MKIRVHQLAKELDISSKELIERANRAGIRVKGNFNVLELKIANRLRRLIDPNAPLPEPPKEEEKKPAKTKAARKTAAARAAEKAALAGEATAAAVAELAEAKPEKAAPPAAEPRPAAPAATAPPVEAPAEPALPKEPVVPAAEAPAPAVTPEPVAPAAAESAPPGVKEAEPPTAAKAIGDRIQGEGTDTVLMQRRAIRPQKIEKLTEEPSRAGRQPRLLRRRAGEEDSRALRHRARPRRPKRPVRARRSGVATRRIVPPTGPVELTLPTTLKSLSQAIGVQAGLLIKKLLEKTGAMISINDPIEEEQIQLLTADLAREVKFKRPVDVEEVLERRSEQPDDPDSLKPRSPIITMMGHVDHGKTSLLDRIREANVVASEAGGITQHIGAHRVEHEGKVLVFLDTPGHEAFTAMRARGANVTDIAVLVVAADDGVMPQTEEALSHARAAGVSIVVAVNKIDKAGADPNRVRQQLSQLELMPEQWGGKTIFIDVSATTGEGIEELLEMLSLEAEMLEVKANPDKPARAIVLEARLDESRGASATVIVLEGTLAVGDLVLCGNSWGRVRALFDEQGKRVRKAGPAVPVELIGLEGAPEAGDRLQVHEDLALVKTIAEQRRDRKRLDTLVRRRHVTLETLFASLETGKVKEVRLVLKADVRGSLEALAESLTGLATEEVKVNILHAGVGGVTESDIILADASDAIVLAFHVGVEERIRSLAQERGVDFRLYDIIYKVLEDMKAAMEGLLEPEEVEVSTGKITVKQIFRISRTGRIAGCQVTEGKVERSSRVRVFRDGEKLHEGKLESLRRFKDDVREVAEGYECGLRVAGFDDIRPGDIIETYRIDKVARKLTT